MSDIKVVDIEITLQTINLLLGTGNPEFAKDIRNLLDIIELQKNPPVIISGKFAAPNQPTKDKENKI